jgi:hypothetical protein
LAPRDVDAVVEVAAPEDVVVGEKASTLKRWVEDTIILEGFHEAVRVIYMGDVYCHCRRVKKRNIDENEQVVQ